MVQEMARSPINKHSTLFHPITGILSIQTNMMATPFNVISPHYGIPSIPRTYMMAIPSQKLAKNSKFNHQ
jgi:hypothetical protein